MLASPDLDVNVLVVVAVERSGGVRVTQPEIDGVGVLVESYAGKRRSCGGNIGEEGDVFVAEVVILYEWG